MDDLVITASGLADIQHAVLGGATERCVVLLCSAAGRSDGRRVLVRELVTPTDDDYLRRGPYEAELRPAFVALVAKKAARTNSALVFVHSHPGRSRPDFSPTDDAGEAVLARFFAARTPDLRHVALVVSEGGVCCRYLGSETYLRVIALGEYRRVLFDSIQKTSVPELYDRQVRAFGKDGQNILQDVKVGIVGVGGTGSIAVQQLAHLGVQDFMLFDHDRVEVTNLNRLVGSTPDDVGVAKTAVAKRSILAIRPDANVLEVRENVVWVDTALKLRDVDAIFCCTDSHGSRAVIQQLAYQYLIPCFDVGNVIAAKDGQVSHIAGAFSCCRQGSPV